MTQYGRKARGEAPTAVRPVPALGFSGEQFQGRSVTQDSYGAFEAAVYEGQGQVREEAKVQREADDRSWQTETRAHFQRKTAATAPVLPDVRRGVAFDGEGGSYETESRRFYQDHGDCKREGMVPLTTKTIGGERFEGVSSMQDAYRTRATEGRRQLMRPVDALKEREADDRHWVSESRYHYQQKTVEHCPAEELEDRWRKDRHGHIFYEKEVGAKKWSKTFAGVQRSGALW
jgi:hypothetical protein